jgi:maleylpyruvate isomerase
LDDQHGRRVLIQSPAIIEWLDAHRGDFCFGRAPTLADVYLIPQVESARRFKVDMGRWPLIAAVDAACAQIDAFRRAAPAMQPDAA